VTPSIGASPTPTETPTPTQTPTNTETPTQTPTNTETPTQTPTLPDNNFLLQEDYFMILQEDGFGIYIEVPNPTPTPTPTPTQTETPTQTPTNTPTETPTPTNTETPTNTVTPTNTETPTQTQTPTNTETPTQTPTTTTTLTPTSTVTPTSTNLTTDRILYWNFSDPISYSGTSTVFDLENNSNGTIMNSPLSGDTGCGTFVDFNGTTQYIYSNTDLSSFFTGVSPNKSEVTSIFMWIYPQGDGVILSEVGTSNSLAGWHTSIIEMVSGTLKFGLWNGTANSVVTSSIPTPLNNWYYVGMTYNGSTLTAYVNGVSAGTVTFNRQAPYNVGVNGLFYLLAHEDVTNMGDGGFGDYRVGSFEVYTTSLNSTQINNNYTESLINYICPTPTPTVTPTNTNTPTNTYTPTQTPTPTPTLPDGDFLLFEDNSVATAENDDNIQIDIIPSPTPTNTVTPTNTETPTQTQTPTNTITGTLTPTPSTTPSIVTSGLVIQLDANDSTSYSGGTTVFDITGGYNHTLIGATYTVLNGIKCFDCTTGNNRVNYNLTGPTLPNSGYTYITWARLIPSTAVFRTLLYTSGPPKITPITIPNASNALGYWATGFVPSGYDVASSVGVWVQFAVVGTNTSQTFYINGSQEGSTINEGAGGTRHWGWGNNDTAAQPWGHVANMYFYNRQLNLAEITQQYNYLAPRFV
jgi:hypothetical protein